jgi:hypothetical protein
MFRSPSRNVDIEADLAALPHPGKTTGAGVAAVYGPGVSTEGGGGG